MVGAIVAKHKLVLRSFSPSALRNFAKCLRQYPRTSHSASNCVSATDRPVADFQMALVQSPTRPPSRPAPQAADRHGLIEAGPPYPLPTLRALRTPGG